VATSARSKNLIRVKRAAIAAAVVLYIGGAAVGTAYGSAALFQLFHKQRPHDLALSTTLDDWESTADNRGERKKLLLAIGIPAMALFFALPMALASIGPKRRELHGSSRFANRMEVQKAGLLGDRGILLGKYQDQFLALPGQQSVLLAAPMRSWKGVGVVIPNLLAWPDSACVVDIKGENFDVTAGFRAKHGQQVSAWAPFAKDGRSHCYNPLSYVRLERKYVIGDILSIAQIIYAVKDNANGTEGFFNDHARSLFLGLTLYLVETPELPRTIGELFRQGSGQGRPIKEHVQGLILGREETDRPLSSACVDALNRFLSNSDNTLTGILSTFNAPLLVFSEPLVDASTSRDDFSLLDLRRKRMTVYVLVPPNRLADASVLLNLFFSQLVNLNTNELPSQNPALKYECLLVNDEFTAMGRVAVFEKALGYLAGYGLRCLTVIQAGSQLDATYGEKNARTMVTNHAAQILYAPREQRDAKEYSEMLGTFTEKSESRGRSNSNGARGGSSTSTNTSAQRRDLLLPQEFKELGIDKEVVLLENTKPILADKICYYTDPVFMPRLLAPPQLPEIDLDLHFAKTEQRVRVAEDGETFSVRHIAADFSKLPSLAGAANSTELSSFVSGFFQQLAVENTHADNAITEEIAP
jgi:type IV secretion system protein VirD4